MSKILIPGDKFDGVVIPQGLYVEPSVSTIDKVGFKKLGLVIDIFSDENLYPRMNCSCKGKNLGFFVWTSRVLLRTETRYMGFATKVSVKCLTCKKNAQCIEPDVPSQNYDQQYKEVFSKNIENIINTQLNSGN